MSLSGELGTSAPPHATKRIQICIATSLNASHAWALTGRSFGSKSIRSIETISSGLPLQQWM